MMYGRIAISEVRNSNGTYSIWLNNIRKQENAYQKISSIIMNLSAGSVLYFGHYKLDGVYMSSEEFKRSGHEIITYFEKFGKFMRIDDNKKNNGSNDLVVCSAPNNANTYEIMKKIFQYYLESIVFSPRISWDTFVSSYKNYIKGITKEYVLLEYTDFLFLHTDSEQFSITFNPEVYEPKAIREKIEKILKNI